ILVIINFTPIDRNAYRIGVPYTGKYKLLMNSSDENYSISGKTIQKEYAAQDIPWDGMKASLCVDLKGLTALYIKKV
ncbi:MAG: alpha amylase C-terminal domain-containing protein, partial [Clostridia bacterium]